MICDKRDEMNYWRSLCERRCAVPLQQLHRIAFAAITRFLMYLPYHTIPRDRRGAADTTVYHSI